MNGTKITGTLNYVNGSSWDGAGWPSDEEAGNFIALKVTGAPEDAMIILELLNGVHGPVTLDEDRNMVIRIANKNTQKIKITAMSGHYKKVLTYDISGLTLGTAA